MQGAFEFYRELPARPKRPEWLFFALFPDAATGISNHDGRVPDDELAPLYV